MSTHNNHNNSHSDQQRQTLCQALQARFKQDQPYTQLDTHCLVVVNPYKQLELLNDVTLEHYVNYGYKDFANATGAPEPHVYEWATRMYYVMRRRTENITVLLRGISGSGKSTTHQHLLHALLLLSSHTKRESKIQSQITSAQTVLAALGNASTAANPEASHLDQYHTLYFSERGRILGSHMTVYLLDKQRVTQGFKYNIFYQLLAGTNAQEKAALHIQHSADHFQYLRETHGQRSVSRDEIAFSDFKAALKQCGIKAKTIAQICQLLAAILHLGNVQFVSASSSASNSNSSPSAPSPGGPEGCRIKNKDALSLVAAALGVATPKLEGTLTHKLKLLGKEFCTAFLTAEAAQTQRDNLARTLYTVLVSWIVQTLNVHGAPAVPYANCIGIFDAGRFDTQVAAGFRDLCSHFASERIYHFLSQHHKARHEWHQDGLAWPSSNAVSSVPTYIDGLVPLLNRESERLQAYALDATDANFYSRLPAQQQRGQHIFAIQHYASVNMSVEYSVDGFLESNLDALSPDFILLFRYNCTNVFIRDLFTGDLLRTETHPRDERTIIKAQLPTQIGEWVLQKQYDANDEKNERLPAPASLGMVSAVDQIVQGTESFMDHLVSMRLFEVIHIRPNAEQKPDVFDANQVMAQLQHYSVRSQPDPVYGYTLVDFLTRYQYLVAMLPLEEPQEDVPDAHRLLVSKLIHFMQWHAGQVQLGRERIWLAFDVWRELENHLRALEKEQRIRDREERERLAAIEAEERERLATLEAEAAEEAAAAAEAAAQAQAAAEAAERMAENPFGDDDGASDIYSDDEDRTEVDGNHGGSQWGEDDDYMDGYGPNMDMSQMVEDYGAQPPPAEELVQEVEITKIRRWWARFVWFTTWWIPSFLLRSLGKMDRQDVRMAWREKVTLCLLIFLFSSFIIFFIVGLGEVLCPGTKELFSSAEVTNHQTMEDYWISIRGRVYDLTDFVSNPHGTNNYMATQSTLEPLAGRDLSYTFPPPLTSACAGLVNDASVTITPNESFVLGPFVHYSGDQQNDPQLVRLKDPNWISNYLEPVLKPNKKGDLVVSTKQMTDDFNSYGRLALAIDGSVYDLTDYMESAHKYPRGAANVPNYHYIDESIENFFKKYAGQDASQDWTTLMGKLDPAVRDQNMQCLQNVFYIGRLDYRDSLRCTFVNYLLLSFAVLMSLVILIKFLAALQFGGAPTPEQDQDKFVICQVPCYTEDEESLRKTIDSLTTMTYDDKRKLLFMVADGMIIGSGNDKPTPRILLDILGHDPEDDPEPVMFKSVGEGSRQLNYGKVYSGLYVHEGHTVPYIIVVKVGKSTERTKPGNRGKRDSQIICMNFLSKVHFDAEMTPLELQIYHHIKNVIGIDPGLYEYVLMVDSDTEVYPDALTRLVSCMLHDSRIIGLCGETELCNEDRSWTTRIQVYEYYISHHLVKAFESLFGSVTCLPGCFCMYRIRTASKRQPLIVSPQIIHGYSDNQVDTLHKKNLLHLGEDRYLTTLMMKTFPQYKMVFTPYARCRTVAPDSWQVLLSQRRRWINSTIHNLLELILLPELCGFCCLSMRFVVIIDLIGTITLPASVVYLVYLLYIVASNTGPVPVIALGMLAGAYGLQALIFIFKQQWQHIGWMVIYLFAIPVFSFLIPIYAFWHFDDFSWGNTRVVVGDKKKQIIVTDDEKFDDKMIPLKKWEQYEEEMMLEEQLKAETQSLASSETFTQEPEEKVSEEILSSLPLEQEEPRTFSIDLNAVLYSGEEPATNKEEGEAEQEEHKKVLPEDDEIERETKRILATANLMTLTKKQVRDQLTAIFGVDLTIKKGFINDCIERFCGND